MHEEMAFEMSRYIDLDLYHEVERSHPFYKEMAVEICGQVRRFCRGKSRCSLLEIGAGTGLMTQELLKHPSADVTAVELDSACCRILRDHVRHERCRIINQDALKYCLPGHFDIVLSTFAHDHFRYQDGVRLAGHIKRNLKPGGIYIMGGEILPRFKTSAQRIDALYRYHCFIVETALRARNFRVAQIEINALKSGIEMTGDFKRHEEQFEAEMAGGGMEMLLKKKMGPIGRKDVGGVFVYVYGNEDGA